jgi:hypothetical protein
VRVVCRFLMVAGFVMFRGLGVVVCSLRMVICSLLVMMRCFLRHVSLHSGLPSWFRRHQARLESSALGGTGEVKA